MRFRGALAATGLGLLAFTGALAAAGADPVFDPILPVDPAITAPAPLPVEGIAPLPASAPPPPPVAAAKSMLGQAVAELGQSNPFNAMADLLANSPQPPLVGQGPLPPDTVSSGPGADPLSLAQLLRPQNYRMPTSDQASPYALAPNTNPSPFARIDAWKGVHALTHSNLGRMPGSELGQPLPGTAPPPGTNLPPGLEQFYIDPAAVPPDALPPADPPLPPPPPAG
jgi:hypothetical protein